MALLEKVRKELTVLQYKEVGNCQKCSLALTRKKIVFGAGNPLADLVVVGEGPGDKEDLSGQPFVGPAGQLLDRILATMGRDRSQVYVMNAVLCRACDVVAWGKKNRAPQEEELLACADFFDAHMNALPNKKLIFAFGGVAANRVLGRFADPYPLFKLRLKLLSSAFAGPNADDGRAKFFGTTRIPLIVTYHPSYLLRTPEEKIKTYNDLLFVRQYLDSSPEEQERDRDDPNDPPKRNSYTTLPDIRKYGFLKPHMKDTYSEVLKVL